MSPALSKVRTLFIAIQIASIILAPAVLAIPAVRDLADLRTVINTAASTIGDEKNPNKGWGFGIFSGGNSQMGTADTINNITITILRSKWQLDTNKTAWLFPSNMTNGTTHNNTTWTPTLPLTASLVLPSVLSTTTPSLSNRTGNLTTPYIDYVSAILNLSTSLISLGRSYHREMNSPVSEAISALQQSISTLQSAFLQSDLIESRAVVRTIRASSSLEDAQQAWSRWLNLPGRVSAPKGDSGAYDMLGGVEPSREPVIRKRAPAPAERPPPADGQFYTHKELWGRRVARPRQSSEGKLTWHKAAAEWEEQRGEHVRVVRPLAV